MTAAENEKRQGKLDLWQRRLADSDAAFSAQSAQMDKREHLYEGDRTLRPLVPGDHKRSGEWKQTSHVRNIIFENIESQVSSSIPQPKVTARRKRDEPLAEIIEHFLRNELDRLPFEMINDLSERTVPIQGGSGFLVEWDSARRSAFAGGELSVSTVHPKQLSPQPGVTTAVEDMDWIIVKIPTTKEAVKRRYGVDVSGEGESEPQVRGSREETASEDAVTQYVGYERNKSGGIDLYSWVNDVQLEDLRDYQARRQPVCKRCGRKKPLPGDTIDPAYDPGQPPQTYSGGPCPSCGSEEWTDQIQDYEELYTPVRLSSGEWIGGMVPAIGKDGLQTLEPTRIPCYRPNLFPLVLQRSVSVYGQLLGNSDVDLIADQQNTVNRLEQKIIDRIVKAGSRVTLPARADLRTDPEDGERWFLESPAEKGMIDVLQFSGDLQYELAYLAQVYEEARQILGITDSFQGRTDSTATSGKAKEFAAAQSAGRLESKRIMKNAAYAAMFELMFKFALAYSDEPRPVIYKNFEGDAEYSEFNRYDFLEQDANGEWVWNDQFLFSCDSAAPLANNREAMWQETRQNLQSGAFGDPQATDTLILFWSKMEELHYPGAASTKKFLEERMEREQHAMMAQQAVSAAQAALTGPVVDAVGGNDGPSVASGRQEVPADLAAAVDERARQDAMRAAGRQ